MSLHKGNRLQAAYGRLKWMLSWDEQTRAIATAAILIVAGLFLWH